MKATSINSPLRPALPPSNQTPEPAKRVRFAEGVTVFPQTTASPATRVTLPGTNVLPKGLQSALKVAEGGLLARWASVSDVRSRIAAVDNKIAQLAKERDARIAERTATNRPVLNRYSEKSRSDPGIFIVALERHFDTKLTSLQTKRKALDAELKTLVVHENNVKKAQADVVAIAKSHPSILSLLPESATRMLGKADGKSNKGFTQGAKRGVLFSDIRLQNEILALRKKIETAQVLSNEKPARKQELQSDIQIHWYAMLPLVEALRTSYEEQGLLAP